MVIICETSAIVYGKANGNNKDKNEQKKLENAGITKNKFVKWA